MESGVLALIALGLILGLRHGVDWDHIAAIADITATPVGPTAVSARSSTLAVAERPAWWADSRQRFFLATLYALGHATVVVLLGLLAIWGSTLLPEWIDPVIERVVGFTLLALGIWVFYSIWRDGRNFRLRSRWMLVFSLVGATWARLKAGVNGRPVEHVHDAGQYGPKTAYGVGMIHGVGAETGSQALLLAGAAGATSVTDGSLMLLSFTIGLVISNSLVAAFSAFGIVSSQTKQNVYLAIGVIAGVFSLVVGLMFLTGQGAALPDLQDLLDAVFGPTGADA